MDRLRNEIKDIKKTLGCMEPMMEIFHSGIKDMEKSQEYMELRLDVSAHAGERLTGLEKYANIMCKHLNDTISRVNDIHGYLKERDEHLNMICERLNDTISRVNDIHNYLKDENSDDEKTLVKTFILSETI